MKSLIAMLLSLGILTAEISQSEIDSSEYLIIDVYADWCGPCKKFGPIFEEVSKELSSKYRFAKSNIDLDKYVSKTYKVSSVPTILFLKNGKEVGRAVGYMSKETFQAKITNYYGQ